MDLQTLDLPSRILLSTSTSFEHITSPRATTSSSFQDYVLNLACLDSCYAASFSPPSNSILLLDKERLRLINSLKAHSDAITLIRNGRNLASFDGTSVLISSGRDGLVKVWDPRSPKGSVVQFDANRGILSFDISSDGQTLATGTELRSDEAHLVFWDVRKPSAPVHFNTSQHSDDITSLSFHPTIPHIILSGSTDGLLCTTDTREQDEDEAGLLVGNWGCSISAAGWTSAISNGSSAAPLTSSWAHSDMQTLSTWTDDLDLITDFGDLRKPRISGQWESEYFIDSTWLHPNNGLVPSSSGLGIWAGSNNGDISLIIAQDNHEWSLERTLSGSHTDIVRSVLWDEKNSMVLTGGEDSRISAWSVSSQSMDIDHSASRNQRGAKSKRKDEEDEEMEGVEIE